MSEQPESAVPPERARDITLLRNTLSMLCNFIWTKRLRPGEHLWSIPADKVRDFDMILSDAIDELEWRRSLAVGGGAVTPSAAAPVRCEQCGTTANSVNGVLCGSCWTQSYLAPAPGGASLHEAAQWAEERLSALVTEDDGNGAFVRHKGVELAGFGAGMKRLREALASSPTPPPFDFAAHLQRQREWSERTFGPGPRAAGVVDHIRKELREIEADPTDASEWADVVILGLDGFWRAGYTPEQIIAALVAKQTKNEARTWPDWRTAPIDKAIEHDRSADPGKDRPNADAE